MGCSSCRTCLEGVGSAASYGLEQNVERGSHFDGQPNILDLFAGCTSLGRPVSHTGAASSDILNELD